MITAPKVLHEWTFLGMPYRLVEGEEFNPSEPEYIVEEKPFAFGTWRPINAIVMEEGVLIQSLLQRRAA